MTPEEFAEHIAKINAMSHEEMARLWRFTPAGHPYMDSRLPFWDYFRSRFFDHFGGFTPEISKRIGWGNGHVE